MCVDGRAQIYEEVLDWRPFEYFTERRSLAGGPRVLLTTALDTVGTGTRIVTTVRPDGVSRLAWLRAAPRLRRSLRTRYRRLAALVPTAIAAEKQLPLAVAVPPA